MTSLDFVSISHLVAVVLKVVEVSTKTIVAVENVEYIYKNPNRDENLPADNYFVDVTVPV